MVLPGWQKPNRGKDRKDVEDVLGISREEVVDLFPAPNSFPFFAIIYGNAPISPPPPLLSVCAIVSTSNINRFFGFTALLGYLFFTSLLRWNLTLIQTVSHRLLANRTGDFRPASGQTGVRRTHQFVSRSLET